MAVVGSSNIDLQTEIGQVLNGAGGAVNVNQPRTYFTSGANINKWSFRKPIEYQEIVKVTDDQIKSVHCGLTPRQLLLLRTNCNGFSGTTTNYTKDEILEQVTEWVYTLPSTYFRLSDFVGYNTEALPSDKNWEDYSFLLSDLTAFVNSDASLASSVGGVNYTIDKTFKQMYKFAINVSGNYNYIGDANEDMIPLSYIAGDGVIDGEGWRIAYAVQIPYNTLGASNEWYLFIGRKVLNSSDSITNIRNYCPPDMSSNTLAVNMLIYNVQSKGIKTFSMIPCLVKNAMLAFHSINASTKRSQVILDSTSMIYSMPSGAKFAKLNITTSEVIPTVGSVTGVVKYGSHEDAWVLGYLWTGSQQGSYGAPINALVVVRSTPITGGGTVRLAMQYEYILNGSAATTTIPSYGSGTSTFTINAGATFTMNGETYNGIVIGSNVQPGLYFSEDDVTTFTVS